MFNPVPPRSKSTSPDGRRDNAPDAQNPQKLGWSLSQRFLFAGMVCQALCGLFTLLPWSRETYHTYAGYEPHSLPWNYDGIAGKTNLLATVVLLGALTLTLRDRSKPAVYLFTVGWNLIISIWLIIIHDRLDVFSAYGLLLTIGAAFGVTVCVMLAFIMEKREDPE